MATVDLCILSDIRTQTEIPTTTTTPDSLLTPLITAASRAIARRYEREFITEASGATTRTFRVDARVMTLAPYDLRANPTTVVMHPESPSPTTLDAGTDYAFTPSAGAFARRQLRFGRSVDIWSTFASEFGFAQVAITASETAWGMFANTAAVPDDIRRACVLTVSSWLQRDIASLGIEGFDDQRGIRPALSAGWPIPTAAHHLLAPYKYPVIG